MGCTILAYRNDCRRPSAEVRLPNGDHVVLALHAGGVAIDRLGLGGHRLPLFRGDVETVVAICAALSRTAGRATPLDRLLAIVIQFTTATDLAAAFTAASDTTH